MTILGLNFFLIKFLNRPTAGTTVKKAWYGPNFNELLEFESVTWFPANFTLSMKIYEDFAIPADTEYLIKFDTVFADPDNGIIRGVDTGSNALPAATL